MASIVKCRMVVEEAHSHGNSFGTYQTVKMRATPDGNEQWSRWTPSAEFEMEISRPASLGAFSEGDEVIVEFTVVEG